MESLGWDQAVSSSDHDPGSNAPPDRGWALPDAVWAPLVVAGLLAVVGAIALAAGQPWLFPSLGPSAYLVAETPDRPSSRFYNGVVGHLVGFAAGAVVVGLLGAADAPSVLSSKTLTPVRAEAAALSAGLTMVGLIALRASHPPAAATTLLVALGGFKPTWADAARVAAGALILATLGEGVRHARMRLVRKPGS